MKKGSHHSKETIKKMSKAKKGKYGGEKHYLYGKHLPKETIEKMSKAKKGKTLTEDHKKKISLSIKGENHPNFGKYCPKEVREKISKSNKGKSRNIKENNPMYGKKIDKEIIEKRVKSRIDNSKYKGKDHWNWQGGVSYLPYCSKFNEEFKEKTREKFNRQCFVCGLSEELNNRKLSVHHINYNKDCLCNNSKCYFVPLCDSCHIKTNSNRQFWERLLTNCCEDSEMMRYFNNRDMELFEINKKVIFMSKKNLFDIITNYRLEE